jgi:hypothetical protein
MKIFAAIGILVSFLAVLGAIGVGHFRLYYGPEMFACEVRK